MVGSPRHMWCLVLYVLILKISNLFLLWAVKSCDRRADGTEVFLLGAYKAPAKSVWFGFEKYPSCFHLQKL